MIAVPNALSVRESDQTQTTGVLGVHPGHGWFFVESGSVDLTLGDRQVDVRPGEAAEFATMTPHGFAARK